MWPNSLSSNLPPFRTEEPTNLRQDITDELADHLATAIENERQSGADETLSWLAALERFGDPAEVARQLWFDAMKETIMRQRALLVLAALLVIAVFAANGIAWMAFQRLRDSNAELVARLNALSAQRSPSESAALLFELVKEGTDAAAVGYTVELLGDAVDADSPLTLHKTSDANGQTQFAPIRPGSYNYWISTPWKWRTDRLDLALLAGPALRRIECPATPPLKTNARINVVWPGKVNDRIALAMEFVPTNPKVRIGELNWNKETGFTVVRSLIGNAPSSIEPDGPGSDVWRLGAFKPSPAQSVDVDAYELTTVTPLRRGGKDGPTRSDFHPLARMEGSGFGQFTASSDKENSWLIEFPPQTVQAIEQWLEAAEKAEQSESAGTSPKVDPLRSKNSTDQ